MTTMLEARLPCKERREARLVRPRTTRTTTDGREAWARAPVEAGWEADAREERGGHVPKDSRVDDRSGGAHEHHTPATNETSAA